MTHLYTYVILFFRTVLHYDLNQAAYQIKPCGPDETRSNIKGVYVYTEIVSVYVMCQCVCVCECECVVLCVSCVCESEKERERERETMRYPYHYVFVSAPGSYEMGRC